MFTIKTTGGDSKFWVDSIYNFVSLGLLGLCGIIINIVIARFYGASALGVFNQAYAIHIVFTQLASMGVQLSVLKHVAQYKSEKKPVGRIITSALIIVLLTTSLFTITLYLLTKPISILLDSPDLSVSIQFLLPGLWCLSLNKIFFSVLNANREMKAYAFLSALRYIIMLISLLALSYLHFPGRTLSAIFSIAELVLLLPCFFLCRNNLALDFYRLTEWLKIHFIFGIKSIPGGMIAVLNTRVDVLMLGYFMSDSLVGKYSLAATVVEGVLQLPFVLRRNMDPIITRLFTIKQKGELEENIIKIKKVAFSGLTIVCLLLVAVFPLAIDTFIDDASFLESYRPFVILIIGAIALGTYLPFSGILVQTGFPGYQTIYFLLCFVTNLILNLILISLWGAVGAATATSISFGLSILYLRWYALKYPKISI